MLNNRKYREKSNMVEPINVLIQESCEATYKNFTYIIYKNKNRQLIHHQYRNHEVLFYENYKPWIGLCKFINLRIMEIPLGCGQIQYHRRNWDTHITPFYIMALFVRYMY